jgi:hypothetical protein
MISSLSTGLALDDYFDDYFGTISNSTLPNVLGIMINTVRTPYENPDALFLLDPFFFPTDPHRAGGSF